jgi:hypothetical protein
MDANSIEDLLEAIALPDALSRIDEQRPAFHTPVLDDRRLAYYLMDEGGDPVRLVEALDEAMTEAGYSLEYCERSDFFYSGPMGNLCFRLDGMPDGLSARLDARGRPVEVTRTWHDIPAGRVVVTFAI